jgi:threonine aldolase
LPIELLSITNASEWGRVYSVDETKALGTLAKERGWHFHLDGARFANAVTHLGCHPGDLSWRAGVDILSFGFIKNGGMSAEALILFDPARADELKRRRKRGGHLSSKGRYGAAQLLAMIENDVWLRNARAANAGAASLAAAARDRLVQPCEANIAFLRASADEAAMLRQQGFEFYDWAPGIIRLVVSWDHPQSEIDALADALRRL